MPALSLNIYAIVNVIRVILAEINNKIVLFFPMDNLLCLGLVVFYLRINYVMINLIDKRIKKGVRAKRVGE